MHELKKLIERKKAEGKVLDPFHSQASEHVLSDLMEHMDSMGADRLHGLKKVTVAAPDKAGLEHGLAQAADLVQKGPLESESEDDVAEHGDEGNVGGDHLGEEGSEEHESMESPEVEAHEHDDEEKSPHEMDHEELAHHIEELKKLHKHKKSKE